MLPQHYVAHTWFCDYIFGDCCDQTLVIYANFSLRSNIDFRYQNLGIQRNTVHNPNSVFLTLTFYQLGWIFPKLLRKCLSRLPNYLFWTIFLSSLLSELYPFWNCKMYRKILKSLVLTGKYVQGLLIWREFQVNSMEWSFEKSHCWQAVCVCVCVCVCGCVCV